VWHTYRMFFDVWRTDAAAHSVLVLLLFTSFRTGFELCVINQWIAPMKGGLRAGVIISLTQRWENTHTTFTRNITFGSNKYWRSIHERDQTFSLSELESAISWYATNMVCLISITWTLSLGLRSAICQATWRCTGRPPWPHWGTSRMDLCTCLRLSWHRHSCYVGRVRIETAVAKEKTVTQADR